MSEVAVAACPDGIVLVSESMVVTGTESYRTDAQKIVRLGPRLAFASVGHASLWDPRTPMLGRSLGGYLRDLTDDFTSEADPREAAERLGRFFLEVLEQLARQRAFAGSHHLADWDVAYIVAGYPGGEATGHVVLGHIEGGMAYEADRWTTSEGGRAAIGVLWRPRRLRPRLPAPGDADQLDELVDTGVRFVEMACRRYPRYCGGRIQAATITGGDGFGWVSGREPPQSEGDWRLFGE
ncbi:MAG: hypothetical protein ACE5JM_01360 [Armatimonadota bacterium]